MANVIYRNDQAVWVKVKIPLPVFEAAVAAYGSQHRALRAFREDIPAQFGFLAREALAALADGAGRSPATPAAVPARATPPGFD